MRSAVSADGHGAPSVEADSPWDSHRRSAPLRPQRRAEPSGVREFFAAHETCVPPTTPGGGDGGAAPTGVIVRRRLHFRRGAMDAQWTSKVE